MRFTPERTTVIDTRWIGLGFGLFSATLLVYGLAREPLPTGNVVSALLLLLVCAPLAGFSLQPSPRLARLRSLALVIVLATLALALVAFSGALFSPFWSALLLPMLAALLLMPGGAGAGVAAAIWAAYACFIVAMPPPLRVDSAAHWLLQSALVGLVGLVLERSISAQQRLQTRTSARERALHDFLAVSNRLRVTAQPQRVLEYVAGAVQAAGDFDCVALSLIDWDEAQARVAVAIGARGQRLSAVEGLGVGWSEFERRLDTGKRVGACAIACPTLPFRTLPDETHLLIPLSGQFDEPRGVLSVSVAREQQAVLMDALPLLELLANQAAAALDNVELYATLADRVQHATADLEYNAAELRAARDRAEALYQIARSLAVTLDERQVLEQTLDLVVRSTAADLGGVMLVEPNTGRLVLRTTVVSRRQGAVAELEAGQALAGWVLANQLAANVADIIDDRRWQAHGAADGAARSALAVPVALEREALGVLLLLSTRVGHFSDGHAQLAQAAAGQAAVALAKAHLHRYVSEQSERLGALARQREEEASKLLAILHSIGDGVVMSDRLGRIRMINPAAAQILGITAEAFVGRALDDLPGIPEVIGEANVATPSKFAVGERTVSARAARVVGGRNEWLGSVVVYHDITREDLADRLKSELVATASHELRTPMTSIRGYIDMLLLGTFGDVSASQRDALRVIKNNVTRLVHLIDELLDMSSVESGEVRLHRAPVDAAEVLHDVTRELYSQFLERNVSLTLEVQEQLPPVYADRQRLQQIVVNLVGNACKYTPRGGEVFVTLRNGGGEIHIDVKDTGVGIAESARPHIFTPFYRADNPLRDEVGGTGLGLHITRKLVELHGGRIWFESVERRGSTFSVALPVAS